MLVGATSAFLVMMAYRAIASLNEATYLRSDPIRIIEAIGVGISFLGAGTILKNVREGEGDVEGLTTGASILSVGAIGIAVGLNEILLAFGVTLGDPFVNWGINKLVIRLERNLK